MKSRKNLLEQLKSLPYFSKTTVKHLSKPYGLTGATIDTYISRYLKSKEIIQLKRGLYVAADFLNKNRGDISYSFYLANILRTPSYVSSWAALQYYNLTTEAIHAVTSISPKITRIYETKAGNFSYQSIKKELFSGFSLVKGKPASPAGRFDFFIASPSKALFDLLYFKTHQFRGARFEDIDEIIKETRVDVEEMDEKDRTAFYTLVKKYLYYERTDSPYLEKKT